MAEFTVNEFVIELGFQETVMKGLAKVEKQVLPIANRIEKSINKAFRVDAGKLTQPGINRMVKNVETASRKINASLTKAFQINNLGRGSLRGFENEGSAAARRIAKEMRRAFGQSLSLNPVTVPRTGRTTQPRATPQERINELAQRQHTTAAYGNMQLRTPERAAAYSQRVNALRDQHLLTGDFSQFRAGLRSLNFEFAQGTRQASLARAAEREAARAAAQTGTGFDGLTGKMGALAAGIVALQKAVEYFEGALQEGVKRTQARTMLSTAFGDDTKAITAAVNDVANRYGMDKVTSQEQAAQLRMTLPEAQFSNQQIPQLLETENVFAHQTGMGQEQVGRFNYALQQIASSAKLMGQDWLQVVNASPALIKPLQELTGTKDTRALRDKLKTYTGGEVAKLMIQAMENLNNKSGAAAKAQNNAAAAMGRYSNAVKDGQEQFFNGFDKGFQNLLNALTTSLSDSGGILNDLGEMLGGVFNKTAAFIYLLDQVTSNIRGAIGLMGFGIRNFINQQTSDVQTAFNKLFKDIKSGLGGLFDSPLVRMMRHFAPSQDKEDDNHWYSKPLKWFDAANDVNPMSYAQHQFSKGVGDAYDVAAAATKQSWAKGENGNLSFLFSLADKLNRVAANTTTNLSTVGWKPNIGPSQSLMQMNTSGRGSYSNQPLRIEIPPVKFGGSIQLNIPLPDGTMYTTHAEVKQLIQGNQESQLISATGTGGQWQTQGQSAGWSPSMLMKQQPQPQ